MLVTFDILAGATCGGCGRRFEWTYRVGTRVLSKHIIIYFFRWLKSLRIPEEHTATPFACPICGYLVGGKR